MVSASGNGVTLTYDLLGRLWSTASTALGTRAANRYHDLSSLWVD